MNFQQQSVSSYTRILIKIQSLNISVTKITMILSWVKVVPRQILYQAKIILVTWLKPQDKRVQKISLTRPRQDKITNSWSCLGLSTGGKSDRH